MKRLIALLLACMMIFALCACNKDSGTVDSTPKPTAVPKNAAKEVAASNSDAAANAQSHVPPASSTDTEEDADTAAIPGDVLVNMAIAEAYVGQSVELLYEALGEPAEEPQYAASCLEEGAEDGMLLYDGFYVWTIRTDTEETVHSVGVNP